MEQPLDNVTIPDLPLRMTCRELAALWRVSTRTIERWSANGLCPAPIRIGGHVLFRREDVLAWEVRQRGGSGG